MAAESPARPVAAATLSPPAHSPCLVPRNGVSQAGSKGASCSSSTLQDIVTAAWAEVLGCNVCSINPTDDFFALGGTSLLCGRLNSMLRVALQLPSLSGTLIFQQPTLAAFSAAVQAVRSAAGASVTPSSSSSPSSATKVLVASGAVAVRGCKNAVCALLPPELDKSGSSLAGSFIHAGSSDALGPSADASTSSPSNATPSWPWASPHNAVGGASSSATSSRAISATPVTGSSSPLAAAVAASATVAAAQSRRGAEAPAAWHMDAWLSQVADAAPSAAALAAYAAAYAAAAATLAGAEASSSSSYHPHSLPQQRSGAAVHGSVTAVAAAQARTVGRRWRSRSLDAAGGRASGARWHNSRVSFDAALPSMTAAAPPLLMGIGGGDEDDLDFSEASGVDDGGGSRARSGSWHPPESAVPSQQLWGTLPSGSKHAGPNLPDGKMRPPLLLGVTAIQLGALCILNSVTALASFVPAAGVLLAAARLGWSALLLWPVLELGVWTAQAVWCITAKWVFVGRYRAGVSHLWGAAYLRHWLAHVILLVRWAKLSG